MESCSQDIRQTGRRRTATGYSWALSERSSSYDRAFRMLRLIRLRPGTKTSRATSHRDSGVVRLPFRPVHLLYVDEDKGEPRQIGGYDPGDVSAYRKDDEEGEEGPFGPAAGYGVKPGEENQCEGQINGQPERYIVDGHEGRHEELDGQDYQEGAKATLLGPEPEKGLNHRKLHPTDTKIAAAETGDRRESRQNKV